MAKSTEHIKIPTITPKWPRPEREYPISQRENLMRAFNHEKPVYMPEIYGGSQIVGCPVNGDMPYSMNSDTNDWFGIQYEYSEVQGSPTPMTHLFDEVAEWRTAIKWPDMDALDWSIGVKEFQRDPDKMLAAAYGNGLFERFHMFEPFQNAVMDLLVEPEECHEMFMALADYKIKIFDKMKEQYPLDFIIHNDDWGTAHAPFFSTKLFEQTLLEPTVKFVQHVQSTGTKVMFHNCGKIDQFIPYIVEEIKADMLEIQPLNDLEGIMKKYGDKVTIEVYPDPYIVYDPTTTTEELVAHARSLVDKYGAHKFEGSGAVMYSRAHSCEAYQTFEKEVYNYSSELYAKL